MEKIYWKELIPMFIFTTIMYVVLFLVVWFGHSDNVSKHMAHLATVFFTINVIYLFRISKFKR